MNAATLMPYIDDFRASGVFMLLKRWIEEDMPIPAVTLGHMMGEVVMALRAVVTAGPPAEGAPVAD